MALSLSGKKLAVRGDSRALPTGTTLVNTWPYLVANESGGVYNNDSTSGILTAAFDNSRIPTYDSSYAYLNMPLGTNDVRSNRTVTQYKADYRAKIEAALAKGWSPSLIVISTIGYFTEYVSGSQSLLLACNQALNDLAKEYHTPFLDTYSHFVNLSNISNYYLSDITHENTLGNRELATFYENASYTPVEYPPIIIKNKKILT